jgi:hypothetical protein
MKSSAGISYFQKWILAAQCAVDLFQANAVIHQTVCLVTRQELVNRVDLSH